MRHYQVTARNSRAWTTIADGFVPMDHDYREEGHWGATLTVQESVDHRLLHWDQRGTRTSHRTGFHIQRVPGDDFYWIVFPQQGGYTVRYRDQEVGVGPGGGVVTTVDEVCSIHIPQSKAYAFQVPRTEIDSRIGSLADRARVLTLDSGLGRITHGLIRSTHAEAGALTGREFDAVCGRIAELLCMLAQGDTTPQRSHHGRVVDQVRRYVRANLGYRDVRLPAVAEALGWSPRQVRTLLQRSGTTFRDIRREEALRAARSSLEDPAFLSVPVHQLASRVGLTPAWFSTAFKEAFGETPREFRQRRHRELYSISARDPDRAGPR
ncbi:helix-turn-helix transcriptional regulator [Nocardia spumae]|uniref:helix-turn-helix transcriptional regulator n=1 Tax=Nocardia spumae TaxID=2887190 RepID=UPI001D1493B1|nr:helix-turn-helix domain-containing protein [Nocardia spumae]